MSKEKLLIDIIYNADEIDDSLSKIEELLNGNKIDINGFFPYKKFRIDGYNPLHTVIEQSDGDSQIHYEICKLLIKYGANINIKNSSGYTPLMEAVQSNAYSIVKLLLRKKCDIDAQNNQGITALMMAAHDMEDIKMCKLLLQKGADFNIKNKFGDNLFSLIGESKFANKLKELINKKQ